MRRTSPRRPDNAANVTKQVPESPADPEPADMAAPARDEPAAETPAHIGWGWRLALFLWAASFVFLFLYELLMSLFRGGGR